jgi:hypothetical protein
LQRIRRLIVDIYLSVVKAAAAADNRITRFLLVLAVQA